ncbi:hypothetical protein ES702_07313 [subsurface metagenome]
MKKILTTAVMVLIFIVPAFAGKPGPNQTEIINTSDNPVPITTNDQIEVIVVDEPTTTRDVNIVNPDPIPVSITDESAKKTVISEYRELVSTGTDYIIMAVPTDKKFILTDIIAKSSKYYPDNFNVYLSVKEGSVMKIRSLFVETDEPGVFNLTSGIPFSPGADVVFNAEFSGSGVGSGVYLTITGYLSDP